jgi:hypothetical protein
VDGLTVMVKLWGAPGQLTPFAVYVGVTVTVVLTGVVPLLMAANDAILPVPFAPSPMEVLVFVQL